MSPEVERARPPYVQVAGNIRDRILRGDLGPGDAVPSVRELAADWRIARATAEKALQMLRAEGLVEARPGVGTVVRPAEVYRGIADRYATVRRTGRIYTPGEHAKILTAEQVPATEDVAAAFQVAPGTAVIRRHRVTYLHDEPRSSSTSWFLAEVAAVAPKLLTTERIIEGTARYVERATGRRIRHGQEQILARLATPAEAAELAKPEPLAVLESRHTAWDDDDRPVTYEVGLAQAGYPRTFGYVVDGGDKER